MTKRCQWCKKNKPLDAFCASRNSKDGRHGVCRTCEQSGHASLYPQDRPCAVNTCDDIRSPTGTTSYCAPHDRAVQRLGIVEATEWHLAGKVWVSPPIRERRDARNGDGHLYVCEWKDLIVFGIAAAPELVEARLREHERHMPGLEELDRYSFVAGEAYRRESTLKRLLRRHDHFPWLPKGTPKWTEVVSKTAWSDLSFQQLLEARDE